MAMFDYSRVMHDDQSVVRKPYCLVLSNDMLVMTGAMTETEAQSFMDKDYFTGESDHLRNVPELYEKIVDVRDPQDEVTVYRGVNGEHILLNDNGQMSVNPNFSIEEKQVKLYEMFAYNEYDSGCKYTLDKSQLEHDYQEALDKYGVSDQIVNDQVTSDASILVEDNFEDDHAPDVDVEDVFADSVTSEEPVEHTVSAGVVLSNDIEQSLNTESAVLSCVSAQQVYKTKNPDVIFVVVHDRDFASGRFSLICNRNDVSPHRDENGKQIGWDINLGAFDKQRNISTRVGDQYETIRRTSEDILCSYENTSANHKDFKSVYLNGVDLTTKQVVPDSALLKVTIPFDVSDDKTATIKVHPSQVHMQNDGKTANLKFGNHAGCNVSFTENGESMTRRMAVTDVISLINAMKPKSKARVLPDMGYQQDAVDVMSMDSGFSM